MSGKGVFRLDLNELVVLSYLSVGGRVMKASVYVSYRPTCVFVCASSIFHSSDCRDSAGRHCCLCSFVSYFMVKALKSYLMLCVLVHTYTFSCVTVPLFTEFYLRRRARIKVSLFKSCVDQTTDLNSIQVLDQTESEFPRVVSPGHTLSHRGFNDLLNR